jgi:stage II sporulation SpoM-like protein
MEANEYAFVHGMRGTRTVLARWSQSPVPVLRGWFAGAALISALLLSAVLLISSLVRPDTGFSYTPVIPEGLDLGDVLAVMGRNSLVLALHAFACVAGFIAGSSLPLSAARRQGLSRWVHEKARPIAFAWVIFVTCFSLITQAFGLGIAGSTIASSLNISPGMLLLTALPHAMLELTAVFLPLAAWTIASRKEDWDQLLAATLVTVAMAIPMLLVAATWEVHVWPYILRAVSPLGWN